MARKKESIFDLLILLPWWVSVVLSSISYLVLGYFIPSVEIQQKGPSDFIYIIFNELIVKIAPTIAPIVAIFLLIPAPISAIKSRRKRRKTQNLSYELSPLPDLSTSLISKHYESKEIEEQQIDLSVKTLKKIEWYSFELFCKLYYESAGFKVIKTKAGADKGVDLLLYQNDSETPYALVQCKARTRRDIGVNYVRELLGVMTSEKIEKGIIITNSFFTKEAVNFAKDHPIEMIDLHQLSSLVDDLEPEKREGLIKFLESNDFTTPTCPNCEIKLVERTTQRGKYIGQNFWGCINYPRCNYKLQKA